MVIIKLIYISKDIYICVSFSGHQTTSDEVLSEPWFLALLGSVVLTVLILIFVGIILYRKQWSRQKGLGQLSLPGIKIDQLLYDIFPAYS